MKLLLLTLAALTLWLATRPERVCTRRHVEMPPEDDDGITFA